MTTQRLNGCHSLPRANETKLLIVQDGFMPIVHDGFGNPQVIPKYKYIQHFTNNAKCMYDLKSSDEGCKGCPSQMT